MRFSAGLICVLVVSFSCFHSSDSVAGTNPDGNVLLESCKSTDDPNPTDISRGLALYCLGLVQGVMNTHVLVARGLGEKAMLCTPEGVTTGQGVKIVKKYLDENPSKLHQDSTVLVTLALMNAFPCEASRD